MSDKRLVNCLVIQTMPHVLYDRDHVTITEQVYHPVYYHLPDLDLLQFLKIGGNGV